MRVRRTTQEDLPEILELIKTLHEESLSEFDLFWDESVLGKVMPPMVETSLVLVVEDKIVGVIAGFVTNHIANDKPLMQEMIWHVKKEYRGYGKLLLDGFKKMCKDLNMNHLIITGVGSYKREKFETLCLGEGFEVLETHYIIKL